MAIYPSIMELGGMGAVRLSEIDYLNIYTDVNKTSLYIHFRNGEVKEITFTSLEEAKKTLRDIVAGMEFFENLKY